MSQTNTTKSLSRRAIVSGLCASFLSALPAFARSKPLLKLPASIVFLRMDENGAVAPAQEDHTIWSQFSMNLGALISRIEPIPDNKLLPGGQLETGNGQGSAILSARMAAQNQGYDYLIVYGVVSRGEGIQYRKNKSKSPIRSFSRNIASKLPFWDWKYTTEAYEEKRPSHLDMLGEAHFLDLKGGAPLASSWAEIPKRSRLEKLTSKDLRDVEIVQLLADGMQRKVQDLSLQNFHDQRTISQRF